MLSEHRWKKRERERKTKFRAGSWQLYELIQSLCLSVSPLDLLTELNGTPCIMYETSILFKFGFLNFFNYEGCEIFFIFFHLDEESLKLKKNIKNTMMSLGYNVVWSPDIVFFLFVCSELKRKSCRFVMT